MEQLTLPGKGLWTLITSLKNYTEIDHMSHICLAEALDTGADLIKLGIY